MKGSNKLYENVYWLLTFYQWVLIFEFSTKIILQLIRVCILSPFIRWIKTKKFWNPKTSSMRWFFEKTLWEICYDEAIWWIVWLSETPPSNISTKSILRRTRMTSRLKLESLLESNPSSSSSSDGYIGVTEPSVGASAGGQTARWQEAGAPTLQTPDAVHSAEESPRSRNPASQEYCTYWSNEARDICKTSWSQRISNQYEFIWSTVMSLGFIGLHKMVIHASPTNLLTRSSSTKVEMYRAKNPR